MTFRDRSQAGEALAKLLVGYAGRPDVTVLGLVRGGVPVASVVAGRLGLALDALVVRKLGVPWTPEVAFGAVGPGGALVLNPDIADRLPRGAAAKVQRRESVELRRREGRYRPGRPPVTLTGRIAILVDDGIATGATARVAVAVARGLGATQVVVATPVGAADALARLEAEADEVVCAWSPEVFQSVSRFYRDFTEVSDEQVAALLST
jgi:predicted phosphoribosyltransferase